MKFWFSITFAKLFVLLRLFCNKTQIFKEFFWFICYRSILLIAIFKKKKKLPKITFKNLLKTWQIDCGTLIWVNKLLCKPIGKNVTLMFRRVILRYVWSKKMSIVCLPSILSCLIKWYVIFGYNQLSILSQCNNA